MKIAIISTTVMVLPPKGYSGLEMIVHQLTKGLARKGHKLLLIAPIGSEISPGIELHGTTLMESEKQAYSGYWHRLNDYECIIDHSWEKWSYMYKIEGKLKPPILGVIHAPAHTMYRVPPPVPKPCIVAISNDQAQHAKECWKVEAKTVHNGIDLDSYKPIPATQTDHYLFLARMSSIKGPHIAIDVAKKCGIPLDLVGDDTLVCEPEYVAKVKSQVGGNIVYHGPVERAKTVEFYCRSKALLHMNMFYREPFGLGPVEAQACGCPVIAFDNGAMRETIQHGKTGFLVHSPDEVEELVKKQAVCAIDPKACREWASNFSVQHMVDTYEGLAKLAIETGGW